MSYSQNLNDFVFDSNNNDLSTNGWKENNSNIDSIQFWNQYQLSQEDNQQFDKDLRLIRKISSENKLYRLMTSSLCPQIYGHEMVKSALVLSLFGGTNKVDKEDNSIRIRGQIHILIVGDHGSGKDLLLKSVNSISHKSQYVFGNTSTLNGLTANIVKHKNKHFIEKGSLLLSNSGICCIDEFDKMNGPQHQVLEEVMESQTISLIKKGFVHEMSANVSIISAANPNSGAYDNSKNVWENIKCNASVISKFDLVFVLNDSPDEELDSKLSEEVLLSRRQNGSNARNSESKSVHSTNRSFSSQFTYNNNNNNNRNDCNLMLKLIYGPEEEEPDLIPHCLLKKYVSFAQQYIHPVVSHEAKEVLNAFSQEIAKSKITKSKTKQLELLYRLTESRAKLELRSEATLEDAMDVIDIVKHSINNQLIVSTIAQPIRGSTKRAKAHNLIKALQTVSQQTQQNLFSVKEIIEICYKFKLEFDGKEDIMEAIDKLNNETLLLLQNGSNYKLNLQNY